MLPLPSSTAVWGLWKSRFETNHPKAELFRFSWLVTKKLPIKSSTSSIFHGRTDGVSTWDILGKNPWEKSWDYHLPGLFGHRSWASWGFHTENKMQVIDGNWAFYHPASDANEDSTIQNSAIGIIKPCYENGVLSNKKWNHQIWGVDQQYTGM